jgi:outer membrane protein assembly factor BamB
LTASAPFRSSARAPELARPKSRSKAVYNWSFWRGPEQIGVSRERDLPAKWSLEKDDPDSNLVWTAPFGGITTPIIQDNHVYVINKVGEGITQQESVMAFDAETGKKVWEHKFNVFLTGIVEDRLGWTQMVGDPETGNVYAHGTQGFFFCFSKDGKVLWQHSLTEEYGRVSGYGGRLASPIVDGDLVILGMANASWGEQTVGTIRFVAFDKRKGDVVWWGSGDHRVRDTYYSNPVVSVINGQRLMLSGGGDGCIHAFEVRTGEKVWSYLFGGGAVNCSPVVKGNLVYIGHGEENEDNSQGRVICLDASKVEKGKPKLVWKVDGIKVKFASPILHEDRLYVCDEIGRLYCLDAKDGKQIWDFKYGANTKGSPVWADDKIYVTEVDGRFHILEPGKDECTRLSVVRFRPSGVAPVELNGSPAVAHGKVYLMTSEQLLCIGKKGHEFKADPIPPKPKEPPAAKDAKPTHLQVVPADVTLHPGQGVEFKARTFDANGRLLGEVKAKWVLERMLPPVYPIGLPAPKPVPGPQPPVLAGTLSEKSGTTTKFTAAAKPPAQFGRVMAEFGDLVGNARVRVAPLPPYKQDFENVPVGRTPPGWVNTAGKFAVVELEGDSKVLSKRNNTSNPLVARAEAYISSPDLSDYTTQADVMGRLSDNGKGKNLPDVGVGANRYTFWLAGNERVARLSSWDAQQRVEKSTDFTLKPGVWYRLKITVEVKDDKAAVRGKVWPRDQKEPKEWTLEVEDPSPNKEGAPYIYGFVGVGNITPKNPGPSIYYDNVSVTPNKK